MESYTGVVQTPKDAIILLEASRIGLIPRVTRRLKESERQRIKAGDVYIWNEKEAKMRRWTDGRSWSASRVTGSFLTYKEMENQSLENTLGKSGKTGGSGSGGNSDSENNDVNYSYKRHGLIKQSFSVTTIKGEKLHLMSYTTTQEYSNLKKFDKTPSQDPVFQNIVIPKDVYPPFEGLNSQSNSNHHFNQLIKQRKQQQVQTQQQKQEVKHEDYLSIPINRSKHGSRSPRSPFDEDSPISSPSPLISKQIQFSTSKFDLNQSIPRISQTSNLNNQSIQIQLPPLKTNTNTNFQSSSSLLKRNEISTHYDAQALNALDRHSFR